MTFMFVRTEAAFAYSRPFTVTKERCEEFFCGTLSLQYGSMDLSTSIANAFYKVWPGIKSLDCWPHLHRKEREKESLFFNTKPYNDIIKPQLSYLSEPRSKKQFEALSELITKNGTTLGEPQYAQSVVRRRVSHGALGFVVCYSKRYAWCSPESKPNRSAPSNDKDHSGIPHPSSNRACPGRNIAKNTSGMRM
ncbi:hypothetical protein ON010_g12935 [Phytophthora cinnamomi]|nr:hypothetical protein ON010_g12935 [Phytophthora cinnamomi]